MDDLISAVKNLLVLYEKDGKDGYTAFSIDPNERSNVAEMCKAIEALKSFVSV